ncbi:MAG: hypothetical protein JSV05_08625 [Candidatus Bathyarchaeota archaeon]|nr:MAG: hypothetical protein JSV05_08625 [Candidatus Bathyarchaeota archaeon]
MAWHKVDDKTLEMLKEQKAFEDEVAQRLTSLYDSAKNPLVKLYFHRIILDTMRHSDTYQTLIDLNKRALVGKASKERMTSELSTHIKEERKMLEQAKKISRSVEDEKIRQILERIVEDENIHHKTLKELEEILAKESEDWNRYLYDMFTGFP